MHSVVQKTIQVSFHKVWEGRGFFAGTEKFASAASPGAPALARVLSVFQHQCSYICATDLAARSRHSTLLKTQHVTHDGICRKNTCSGAKNAYTLFQQKSGCLHRYSETTISQLPLEEVSTRVSSSSGSFLTCFMGHLLFTSGSTCSCGRCRFM